LEIEGQGIAVGFRAAEGCAAGDDYVIDNADVHELQRFRQPPRYELVGATGLADA